MSDRRPNILFIPVDDLRPQLGCYGMRQVLSPNIDALAADGLVLRRAYCQQAICGPSRASVLTGCRPDTTGIYDLKTMVRDVMPDVVTLPQHFKNHGYETVSIGKVYHHRPDDPQGWSTEPIVTQGDWQGRGYLTDEAIDAVAAFNRRAEKTGEQRRGLGPAYEAADVPDNAYHDGRDTDRALVELDRLAGRERPFFLAVGFHKPHLPFNAPKRYWNLYDPAKLDLAPNPFAPENATPFSLCDWGELRGYIGMPAKGDMPEDLARTLIHGYCACVTYVDAQIGRLLAKLDALHLRDNTIIMLWGDHGWKLGEHASWCKHSNFEIDARAPLIVATPVTRGKALRSDRLVEFVDMYPTLADLAGLPLPEHLEGTSVAPLLDDPDRPWKPAAFNQYPRAGNIMGYAVRTDRFRYVEWLDRATGAMKAHELYDHYSDPQENVNVVDRTEYADDVERLHAMLGNGWRKALPG
ncbi:MAG: sulfatase [Planctomycetota bacterium]